MRVFSDIEASGIRSGAGKVGYERINKNIIGSYLAKNFSSFKLFETAVT